MDYTQLDNGLISTFCLFWYYLIFAIIILRIAWLLFEKFLEIFNKK